MNNFDDCKNRCHNFDDAPKPNDLPGAVSPANDTASSSIEPTLDDLDDCWGGRSDALGG
jgi:hypothetical protein